MTKYNQLGKYRILDELGKGGFATVYRAVDTTLDREVALKVLDPLLMRDEKWVQHFRQEAKTVAALEHPHIVGIYEIGEMEDRLYIAMTLAKGGSLAEVLADHGRLPWPKTLALLQLVCQALDYAHGRGVVHRDLKPANVLLDPEGPLLTDFGFARLLVDNSMSLSLSGGILGTPAYIAPEIWEYDQAEVPADVYALGCITYEMLLGEPLFGGKTPMQVMRAHDKGPQFAKNWPEDVPTGLSTVLRKALAREPGERYSAAGSFWYALNDLEAQAEAEREAAERAAVAGQWHAEAEAAVEEGEWRAAKMAVGRWLAVTPKDVEAQTLQEEIEQRLKQVRAPLDPLEKSYQNLQRLLTDQRWVEAQRQAQAILSEDPNYRDVATLLQQISQMRQKTHRQESQAVMAEQTTNPTGKKSSKLRLIPIWAWSIGFLVLIGFLFTLVVASGILDSFGIFSPGEKATTSTYPHTPVPSSTSVPSPNPTVTSLPFTSAPDNWQYGVRVKDLINGYPASESEVFSVGDYIIAVDDQPILSDGNNLGELISSHAPGDRAVFWLLQRLGREPISVTVKLAEHPEKSGRGYLGIYHSTDPIIVRYEEELFTGDFSFGRDGTGSSCRVSEQVVKVSQRDLVEDEWFYFATPFEDEDIGKHLIWSLYDPDGNFIYIDEVRNIPEDDENCFWQGFALDPHSEPGEYNLVVATGGNGPVFSQEFIIEYYDLDSIPRPERDPLGDFTFGRDGVNSDSCQVNNLTTQVSVDDLDEDKWFYFASPYTMDEISNVLTWQVYGPDDNIVMQGDRNLEDDLDLCFWQGFALESSSRTGIYILEVEYKSELIYTAEFEITN